MSPCPILPNLLPLVSKHWLTSEPITFHSFLASFYFHNLFLSYPFYRWLLRMFYLSLISISLFLAPTMESQLRKKVSNARYLWNYSSNIHGGSTLLGSNSLSGPAGDACRSLHHHMHNQPLEHDDGCNLVFTHEPIIVD